MFDAGRLCGAFGFSEGKWGKTLQRRSPLSCLETTIFELTLFRKTRDGVTGNAQHYPGRRRVRFNSEMQLQNRIHRNAILQGERTS